MKNRWSKNGNKFIPTEISNQIEILPPNIYKIDFDSRIGFYLTETQDKFIFPYKVYGTEKGFIDRVYKTYHNTKGNLGVLMNGIKGTGKTVTSQLICNKLELPVLIIHSAYENIESFINELQQDIILFFDEYEKIYSNRDYSILTVMDGVLNNTFRKLFLLTTNNSYINDSMLQRPGRIRYVKEFGDLQLDVINEIVEDCLVYKKFKDETIKFISTLEIITVDIVKSIVAEINIHQEGPEAFKDVFNIKQGNSEFDVYEIKIKNDKMTEKIKFKNIKITPHDILDRRDNIGESLYIEGKFIGTISENLGANTFSIDRYDDNDMMDPSSPQVKPINLIYKFDPKFKQHNSFYWKAF